MGQTYTELYETFRWHVPKEFNLASACCLQWSGLPGHERRAALIQQDPAGTTRMTTFAELGDMVSQLANGLSRLGAIPGDRVVIMLSQPDDVMVALLACWAIRAVAVPFDPSLNAEVLTPKLKHARSQVALIDASTANAALAAIARCPRIKHVVAKDVYDGRVMSWRGLLARQPNAYVPSDCLPSDRALLVWPQTTLPDLPAASALVMAHQSLIGQLPGFVMAANWFPEDANQLLTTFKPWQSDGLMAAILPALYFGNTVVLTDKLPAAANLPRAVTHVVTKGDLLIDSLRQISPGTHETKPLKALAVLDHALLAAWRERACAEYGVQPNLATFVEGCGLILAQCQDKWSEPSDSSGRLVPGHRIQLCAEDGTLIESIGQPGELHVARTDALDYPDPAPYIQAWPVKETLDVNAALPNWCATGIQAQQQENGLWRVFGDRTNCQTINGHAVSLWEIEQGLLAAAKLRWAQVALVPTRKTAAADLEVWALLDPGPTGERQLKPWREALRETASQAIANAVPTELDHIKIRVGLVDHLALSDLDRHNRLSWQTRAYQALVDFL